MRTDEYRITMCTWKDGQLFGEVQVIGTGEYIAVPPFECEEYANREQAMHDQLMIILDERQLEKQLGELGD